MNFSGKCIELVLESARKAVKGKPKPTELWAQKNAIVTDVVKFVHGQ